MAGSSDIGRYYRLGRHNSRHALDKKPTLVDRVEGVVRYKVRLAANSWFRHRPHQNPLLKCKGGTGRVPLLYPDHRVLLEGPLVQNSSLVGWGKNMARMKPNIHGNLFGYIGVVIILFVERRRQVAGKKKAAG